MKRFLLVPGNVTSNYDGDQHYIGPRKLAALHGVDERECVVAGATQGMDTTVLLRLEVSQAGFYHPVGPAERRQYPLGGGSR